MKELSDILRLNGQLHEAGVGAALATVVAVQGSSYRRPGARMLIGSDGQTTGGVSGGCLERDVVLRAGGVMESGQPMLVRYDTTPDIDGADLDHGGNSGPYSLGCGGAIDVLIEPLRTPDGLRLLRWLQASQTTQQALATVISRQHPSAPLAARMVVQNAGAIDGQIIDSTTTHLIADEAKLALQIDQSRFVQLPSPVGMIDVFIEVLNPPLALFIFGAGNDAVPLVGFAKALGWRVTLVDVRSSAFDPSRSWQVHQHLRCAIGEVMQRVAVDPSAAAVVMTHNFNHDRQLIEWLAPRRLRYLGLLGPRHRTEQLLAGLALPNLRSPIGLDLGADHPEEVALAIVAEITAVLHGRLGAPLSAHQGPIHTDQSRGTSSKPQNSRAIRSGDDSAAVEITEAVCPLAGS